MKSDQKSKRKIIQNMKKYKTRSRKSYLFLMKNEIYKRILSSILLTPLALFFIIKGSFFLIFFLITCFFITAYEWHLMTKKNKFSLIGYLYRFYFLILEFFFLVNYSSLMGQ